MKRSLLCAAAVAAVLALVPVAALALADPPPGRLDRRMRIVPYSPDNVVNVVAAVGATLTIQFGEGEQVVDVALSNTADLLKEVSEDKSALFLKATSELPAQPIFVRTRRSTGETRSYAFQFQAREETSEEATGTLYMLRFTYPADEAARRAQEIARRATEAGQAQLQRELAGSSPPETGSGDFTGYNFRFTAQGNRALAPELVADDGERTVLRFGPRQRMPAVFGIGVDGREESIPYAVNGAEMVILSVPPSFLLRDGNAVLRIMNRGVGLPRPAGPDTGTSSPNVERVIREPAAPADPGARR